MNTSKIISIASALVVSTTGLPAVAAVLTGSDVTGDTLVTINPTTLSSSVVGPFGPSGPTFAMTGLAFNSMAGILYGISPTTNTIYTINTLTGLATILASVSTGGNPNGLAFDSNRSLLYMTDNNSNGLFRYNVATSLFGFVGTITGGFSDIEGLAYDSITDTLFGLSDAQDRIIQINTATAAGTALPNTLGTGTWRGLEFDSASGMLFATRVNPGSRLTAVNPVTGLGTDLGAISGTAFIQGLAVVPEPSTTALFIIGVLVVTGRCRFRR